MSETAKPKVLFVAPHDRKASVNFYQIALDRATERSIIFTDRCEALVSQNSEESYYRGAVKRKTWV